MKKTLNKKTTYNIHEKKQTPKKARKNPQHKNGNDDTKAEETNPTFTTIASTKDPDDSEDSSSDEEENSDRPRHDNHRNDEQK